MSPDTIAIAKQVATQLSPHQIISFLLVVIVLVEMAMIWRAWNSKFAPPLPRRRRTGRMQRHRLRRVAATRTVGERLER